MTIYIPAWLEELPPTARSTVLLRNRYLLKTAALIHDPAGHLTNLARSLGVAHNTLTACYSDYHGVVGAELAERIERVMGKEVLPVEMLRPDFHR